MILRLGGCDLWLILDGKNREIVFLGRRLAIIPLFEMVEELIDEAFRVGIAILPSEEGQALDAELLLGGVRHFQDPIGIEERPHTGQEGHLDRRVGGERESAKHKTILFKGPGSLVGGVVENQRWVAGAGVADGLLFRIDEDVGSGNEVTLEFAASA
jgi:hypothetical protein